MGLEIMVNARGMTRGLVALGAITATAITVHTALNLRKIRRPRESSAADGDTVSVLIPARNEAHRITGTITTLLQQTARNIVEIIVLDDDSTDGTADIVREIAKDAPRVRVVAGKELPSDWLGKPWACQQLGECALGSVLVFTDADVEFAPNAVAAAVASLREADLELLSPYPHQIAEGWAERLMQPMVSWTWVAALPITLAERSPRPSLAAANGQFIVVDAPSYRSLNGHQRVASAIFDDISLLREFKRAGFRGVAANGAELASCRMYASTDELVDGYTKSLWSAIGSKSGSAAVVAALGIVYLLPPLAMLIAKDRRTRSLGAIGYLAGVSSRVMVGRSFNERVFPDALAHPFSIAGYAGLICASWVRKERGTLTWKGRNVSGVDE